MHQDPRFQIIHDAIFGVLRDLEDDVKVLSRLPIEDSADGIDYRRKLTEAVLAVLPPVHQ